MTTRLIIAFLFLAACNSTPDKYNAQDHKIGAYKTDTLLINDVKFIKTFRNNEFYITSIKGDTIVKPANYYFESIFLDIDEDGYIDLRVFVNSNTPNLCENYLFDKSLNTFTQIKNCGLDIEKIKGSPYYYSYNRAGCADMNWESHLSKIENWAEVNIGLMDVKACGGEDDGINIYKIINDGEKELVKTLPIIKFDNNGTNNKWAFSEDYWKNNYKAFE